MKYVDLTDDQKKLISTWQASQLRPTVRMSKESLGQLASLLQSSWAPTIAPIVSQLDADEVIPDETGLAGAQPITAGDVTTFMAGALKVVTEQGDPDSLARYNRIGGI